MIISDVTLAHIVLGLGICLGGLSWIVRVFCEKEGPDIISFISLVGSVIAVFAMIYLIHSSSITHARIEPIDVYRGKTDLCITYSIDETGTIIADSTVMWKKETHYESED